ncbi:MULTISPECIES: CoA transferase [unclassified Sulfitobacter]|jgi:crotonobetainyl-CoA:carnitine CoA-transferase CaiB-like acyl-CoA transferase|uniref:CoA transferase n=1 Tax=unclassified Sulfitobacter TaxID=196795 RepID=UPI0007C3B213|nr:MULTISPECIES: CoA transferase [unclassified Sulfitobacter]KZY06262.1 hypothetical protein A3721_12225 [Sulfitobacter sp. HI0023]KZY27366.1 hypothetical protein A3728_01405 [Sulfitobacter sp. HI0040]
MERIATPVRDDDRVRELLITGAGGAFCTGGDSIRGIAGGRENPAAMMPNSSKQSVTLDLGSKDGRTALLALADTADVLIESFRPGTKEKLGRGWETLCARAKIFAALSGANVPDAPVRTLAEVVSDEDMRARSMIHDLPHPDPTETGHARSDVEPGDRHGRQLSDAGDRHGTHLLPVGNDP